MMHNLRDNRLYRAGHPLARETWGFGDQMALVKMYRSSGDSQLRFSCAFPSMSRMLCRRGFHQSSL